MSEHFKFIHDMQTPGDHHPTLRPKRDRRQKSGTVAYRGGWPYHLMYTALLIGQAVLQIGLILLRPL